MHPRRLEWIELQSRRAGLFLDKDMIFGIDPLYDRVRRHGLRRDDDISY